MSSYIVAIVGRPNVGKSTLFNRLIGYQKAIVDDTPGVTRDRQYGLVEWNGKEFTLVDTGGYLTDSDEVFEKEIVRQVMLAISEADLILFVVEADLGLTSMDEVVAKMLYKQNKKTILTVNKVDNHQRLLQASEFYGLGFEDVVSIASISGSGTGDLLDLIAKHIPQAKVYDESPNKQAVLAIIGQPNVGKSSFLNALVGEERSIVSQVSGTTRDTIFTEYNLYQKKFTLVDTAGIRQKKNMEGDIEYYSVIRAVKAMDESDVLMLLIDATKMLTHQDLNLFHMAVSKGKGIVLLVNKWDLVEKQTNTAKEIEEILKQKLAPFTDVPIIFMSALHKIRVFKAIETALMVYERKSIKITTRSLNEFIKEIAAQYQPPVYRGHTIKIKFITQLPTSALSFALFCNFPEGVKTPYRNYLENQFRKKYDLTGVPIRLFFRKNSANE